MYGEMSCDKGPEFVGKECFGHGISPAENTLAMLMRRPWLRTTAIDQTQSSHLCYGFNLRQLRVCRAPVDLFQEAFGQVTRDLVEFAEYAGSKFLMFMPALGRNIKIVDRTNRQAQTRPMSLQSHQVASGRAYFPNDDDTSNCSEVHHLSHPGPAEPYVLACVRCCSLQYENGFRYPEPDKSLSDHVCLCQRRGPCPSTGYQQTAEHAVLPESMRHLAKLRYAMAGPKKKSEIRSARRKRRHDVFGDALQIVV
jgi:hypothetical protein